MRKAAKIIAIAATAILLLSFADAIVVANYCRYKASRLLAVARTLHPGITTQTQAQKALEPFSAYGEEYRSNSSEAISETITYALQNVPSQTVPVIDEIRSFPFRILYTWTRFSVDMKYENGFLAEIRILEMQQDHLGYPHPNAASVRIVASKLVRLSPDFTGYSEHPNYTFGVDGKGNPNGFVCCYIRRIEMDERATADQMAHALNFRLNCMSSFVRCKNDREILP